MYSLKCHTEDVRGVREDVGRKERILYWFLLRLNDFHDYLYKGFHNSYFKGSYSDSDSHRVKFTKILLKSLQKAILTLSEHIYHSLWLKANQFNTLMCLNANPLQSIHFHKSFWHWNWIIAIRILSIWIRMVLFYFQLMVIIIIMIYREVR